MNKSHVTVLGTCAICEREIAIEVDRLVHHGYKRPGHGSIEGDCFAVGYEPYERSAKACEAYKGFVQIQAARLEARIADVEAGKITYFVEHYPSRRETKRVEWVVGVTEPKVWAEKIASVLRELRGSLNHAEREIARMDQLIAGFELRELGQETRAGAKVRVEREARQAERSAKRAVKAEKARVLAEKNEARQVKTNALQDQLLIELATVSDGDRTAALAIIERVERVARTTPRVNFGLYDLDRHELFVRVGLAVRDSNGFVRYHVYAVGPGR